MHVYAVHFRGVQDSSVAMIGMVYLLLGLPEEGLWIVFPLTSVYLDTSYMMSCPICCAAKLGCFLTVASTMTNVHLIGGLTLVLHPLHVRSSSIIKCTSIVICFIVIIIAVIWGDPHILTHDGHKYTFNGKGEYFLIQTPNNSFSLQARMVPVGNDSQGTVFTAIVSQQSDSDRVQFEVTENGTIVLVNGEQIDFMDIKEQEFFNVNVADLGNSSFSATFSSGAYMEVREENGFFALLIISLPEIFKEVETSGLMGSFNGNVSDDLLPNGGITSLSLNSTIQEIHENFGLTCKLFDTDMANTILFLKIQREN